jgi:hypothetical protein
MAKAKTRRRGTSRGSSVRTRSGPTIHATTTPLAADKLNDAQPARSYTQRSAGRPASRFGSSGTSGMLSSGMVALGCWGMMIFFFFFYPDPNRVLFGCMAALMAVMWSYSFGTRLRRRLRQAS